MRQIAHIAMPIHIYIQQPYHHALCSCRLAEAKQVWAWLVLGWETTREY
uniref:Uncharacterized protein n=1 Tax=Anguilla anguilla TaxID=7936 RepID=A0A0E9QJ36_ANGAN